MWGGASKVGFMWQEEEEEGGRHRKAACLLHGHPGERVTAKTDGPQQLGPALTQTAFISNLLLSSVNLLARYIRTFPFPVT